MASVTIYTSSAGGNFIQKNFTAMQSLVKAHKAEPKVVYVDIDTNGKQFAEEKSGLKGRWPLLFNGDEFIGDLDTIVDLNEDGLLANKLK